MDPLSIIASVVGLVTAASNVSSILSNINSNMRDAPELLGHVLREVRDVKLSLSAIHRFLLGIAYAPKRRLELIQLEQLIATLTEAVMTFSELEDMVNPLITKSNISVRDRLTWALKEDKVYSIMKRLQCHKSSLSLMLNIVQCVSDLEAEQKRDTLQNLVEQLLENSQDISRRLRNIEVSRDTQTMLARYFSDDNIDPTEVGSSPEAMDEPEGKEAGLESFDSQFTNCDLSSTKGVTSELLSTEVSFENDLKLSRVYSRTQLYETDVSFISSVVRSHAWLVYSGLSLAVISVISAIALPVYSHDILNSHRYKFGNTVQAGHLATTVAQNTSPVPFTARHPMRKSTGAVSKIRDYASDMKVFPRRKSAPTGRGEVSKMRTYKLMILGDEDAEQKELVTQLRPRQGSGNYDAPFKGCFRRQVLIDDEPCMLEVFENIDPEDSSMLQEQLIRDCEGYVLVYNVCSRASFAGIRRYQQRVNKVKDSVISQFFNLPYVPMMLVGNYCDQSADRTVSPQEGYVLSRELGCEFTEVSSKDGMNVENAFFDVVRLLRLRKRHKSTENMSERRE